MSKRDENCIFCKIVSKELPSSVIYEDDKFLGFLEINPVSKGHSLLIPKEHHVWVHETPDELLAEFLVTTKKLINSMRSVIDCHRIEIVIDGIKIAHFHAHLIPRWLDDGFPEFKTIKYDSDEEKNNLASKIKNVQ